MHYFTRAYVFFHIHMRAKRAIAFIYSLFSSLRKRLCILCYARVYTRSFISFNKASRKKYVSRNSQLCEFILHSSNAGVYFSNSRISEDQFAFLLSSHLCIAFCLNFENAVWTQWHYEWLRCDCVRQRQLYFAFRNTAKAFCEWIQVAAICISETRGESFSCSSFHYSLPAHLQRKFI